MDIELTNNRVVAIDGGAATGKGRLIDELSQLLRLKGVPVLHLSTGSLYRAVGYAALDHARTKLKDKRSMSEAEQTQAAIALVREMQADQLLRLALDRQIEMHSGMVWVDGAPISVDEQLKGPGVGVCASIVSVPLPVREFVNRVSRRQINEFDGYVIVDGRDITHVVVPDAPLKLLLTVAPHIAAARSPEHTMEELIARDKADQTKPHGRLRTAEDPGDGVIVLPTDNHTPESVRDHVYRLMTEAFAGLPDL